MVTVAVRVRVRVRVRGRARARVTVRVRVRITASFRRTTAIEHFVLPSAPGDRFGGV